MVLSGFDGHFFNTELRSHLKGFNDAVFEGIDHGKNKKISSTGGSAGGDPSFQIFEKNFGLKF